MAEPECPVATDSTLYISVISTILFLLSEFLGMRHACKGEKPKSVLALLGRGAKSLTSLGTPPPTPPASIADAS